MVVECIHVFDQEPQEIVDFSQVLRRLEQMGVPARNRTEVSFQFASSPMSHCYIMLPTPSTDHVSFDQIYEPAEDSFLFLDTLSSQTETAFLTERFCGRSQRTVKPSHEGHVRQTTLPASSSPLVLEVGVGSGVVLAFVAAHAQVIFGRPDVLTIGTEVNGFACRAARETVLTASRDTTRNSVPETAEAQSDLGKARASLFQGIVQADLARPLRTGVVDVLICNPPYVPTSELPSAPSQGMSPALPGQGQAQSDFERDSYLLSLTYAGGVDGMEVTNKLLEQLPDILSCPLGVAYILLCAQNKPDVVKERIEGWGTGWRVDTVGGSGKKGGWESLQIIRIWRTER